MTKQNILTKAIELPLISTTTVWDIHNTNLDSAARNKKSNLYKELVALKKKGIKIVTLMVGAKGWSQHNSTELLLFKGKLSEDSAFFTSSYEFDLTTY